MAGLISLLLLLVFASVSLSAPPLHLPFVIETKSTLIASYPANIHLYPHSKSTFPDSSIVSLKVTYGPCDSATSQGHDHHITFASYDSNTRAGARRLIWLIPEATSTGGCISAWDTSSGLLAGRSQPLAMEEDKRKLRAQREGELRKRGIAMGNETGIDTSGPWFDGVMLLRSLNLTEVDVEKAKAKRIGIVGAGMSGLMTAMLLDSKGLKNWHILEASERVGGRIRTHHFAAPEEYQYQEMGPMRFPETIQVSPNLTLPINDHKLVFSLGAHLNQLNDNNPKYKVDFIPWLQTSPNGNGLVYMGGKRKPDGTVPTQKEIQENPELAYTVDHGAQMTAELTGVEAKITETFFNNDRIKAVAENMFRAHKQFIDEGWDDFSEYGFIHHVLGASLNATNLEGPSVQSFWNDIYDEVYFSAASWRTIDKGLQRLADAFKPLVGKRISYSCHVSKCSWDEKTKKVALSWKEKWSDRSYTTESFDYAVVAAPFSVVRGWRFFPPLPSLIGRAIGNLPYASACKVALQFKTRFWEHLPKPIYGGCSRTDLPGIVTFCYPSYAINSTRPGVLLASYNFNAAALMTTSLDKKEHAAIVLDAMAEIHGEQLVREQYTGKFARQCWLLDEYARGGWADPHAGDHSLYIPEFFKTVNGMVWVGEHTSYTHAWIASALESGVRGAVQLLLELGLVDEAKEVAEQWMGRWMKV
ncbi:flavin-containing amine oxidoreductase-domain containing protein [Tirmania nivea]|nr:flavin-containing amine oxidoreductase-domain containing protein [Tirmania nivea]